MQLKIGSIAFEKFEVLEKIGSGGMGSIYKVRHINLDRILVLKVLRKYTETSQDLVRFQQEAKVLSLVNHSNIAEVYDFGVSQDNDAYIAIDFIEGITLEDKVTNEGALSLDDSLKIFLQIAEALAHAHDKGVIHRDIKPSNVIIQEVVVEENDSIEPHAILLDFGIAKFSNNSIEDHKLTQTGAIIGSPPYMSPEQCQGEFVDSRSDQYSLGCLLFFMLTGKPPFLGNNALETMSFHINEEPPLLDIEPKLDEIYKRLLKKKPGERYESLNELLSTANTIEKENNAFSSEDLSEELNDSEAKTKSKSFWQSPVVLSVISLTLLFGLAIGAITLSGKKKTKSIKSGFDKPSQSKMKEYEKKAVAKFKKEFIQNPEHLEFKPGFYNKKFLQYLKNETRIKRVLLMNCQVDDKDLVNLKHSDIVSLDISKTDVTTLDNVSTFKNLVKLDLSGLDLEEGELKKLEKLPKLADLTIGDTMKNYDLKPIRALKKIKLLNFSRLRTLGDEDIDSIVSDKITYLNLADTDIHKLDRIGRFKYLQVLDISNISISEDELKHLIKLPDLHTLYLGSRKLRKKDIETLSKIKSLKTLKVSVKSQEIRNLLKEKLRYTQITTLKNTPEVDLNSLKEAALSKKSLTEACAINKRELANVKNKNNRAEVKLHMNLVEVFLKFKKHNSAKKQIDIAEKICRVNNLKIQLAEVLFFKYHYFSLVRKYDLALKAIREMTDINAALSVPERAGPENLYQVAICETLSGDVPSAIKSAELAIKNATLLSQERLMPPEFLGNLPSAIYKIREFLALRYFELGLKNKAQVHVEKNKEYLEQRKNTRSVKYATYLFLYAITLDSTKRQKDYFIKVINLLEKLPIDRDLDSRVRYANACQAVWAEYTNEHNFKKARVYEQKEINMIKQLPQPQRKNLLKIHDAFMKHFKIVESQFKQSQNH